MSQMCENRVAVVTGAGGGIGREHALALAAAGAKVVVNDLGGAPDGSGQSEGPAARVAGEITAAGGVAVSNTDNIATWDGAARLIQQAVEAFDRVDVVVNNAGILRDRMLVNMSESDWDDVIAVHLKGTFAVSRHAAAHWRERSKAGDPLDARLINTVSPSGVFGSVGQANYGAAKAGIASFTIIAANELQRYGVTVNAISPTAMTRLTEDVPAMRDIAAQDEARGGFASLSPANIAPVVVWLASAESCSVTGRIFGVWGGRITVLGGWVNGPHLERDSRWTPQDLAEQLPAVIAKAQPNADVLGVRPK